jgi:hypothetical protein
LPGAARAVGSGGEQGEKIAVSRVILRRQLLDHVGALVRARSTKGRPPVRKLETPGTEVAMDLMGRVVPEAAVRSGESPQTEFSLIVLKGQVTVKREQKTWETTPEQAPTWFFWTNRDGLVNQGPFRKEHLSFFSKDPPDTAQAREMIAAVDTLLSRAGADKSIDLVLDELLRSEKSMAAQRTLAVYCLGALDLLPQLLDCIEAEERAEVRQKAVPALVHWLGRKADHEEKLFQTLVGQKMYKESQATTVLQ